MTDTQMAREVGEYFKIIEEERNYIEALECDIQKPQGTVEEYEAGARAWQKTITTNSLYL